MPVDSKRLLRGEQKYNNRFIFLFLILTWILSLIHMILGSNPVVVILAAASTTIAFIPLLKSGSKDIGAWLIAATGFRYVGFPIFAKLLKGQTLDSNLSQPIESFLIVLIGVISYSIALRIIHSVRIKNPLLRTNLSIVELKTLRMIMVIVGITANIMVILRYGQDISGLTIASFFRTILHLALILSLAIILIRSKGRQNIDSWVIFLLSAEVVFALASNQRALIIDALIAYFATLYAFGGRISWRMIIVSGLAFVFLTGFITPWFLYVRDVRSSMNWSERLQFSIDALENWETVKNAYNSRTNKIAIGTMSYYGSREDLLQRASLVGYVDMLKTGADRQGIVGWDDISMGIWRNLPTFIAPNKPRGHSHGDWLLCETGIRCFFGSYMISPHLANAYAAFGWSGVFFYPLCFGFLLLFLVKLSTGLNLHQNFWSVYMLVSIYNTFTEGSTGEYFFALIRQIPQNILLISLILLFTRIVLTRSKFSYIQKYTLS